MNSKQIISLSLIPICSIVQVTDRRNGGGLVGVGLDTDTGVVLNGQQVVDNLETLVAGGVVDSRNVRHLGELRRGVVLQESEDGNDGGGGDVDGELVFPDGELLDVLGQGGD